MANAGNREKLHEQMSEFEKQNPKVAEALRLFEISFEKYQGALNSINPPRVFHSNSTTSKKK